MYWLLEEKKLKILLIPTWFTFQVCKHQVICQDPICLTRFICYIRFKIHPYCMLNYISHTSMALGPSCIISEKTICAHSGIETHAHLWAHTHSRSVWSQQVKELGGKNLSSQTHCHCICACVVCVLSHCCWIKSCLSKHNFYSEDFVL